MMNHPMSHQHAPRSKHGPFYERVFTSVLAALVTKHPDGWWTSPGNIKLAVDLAHRVAMEAVISEGRER